MRELARRRLIKSTSFNSVVFKLYQVSELPRGLVKAEVGGGGTQLHSFSFVDPGMGKVICHSIKFPNYVDAVHVGTTLGANCCNPED